jgi:hypothetical protein
MNSYLELPKELRLELLINCIAYQLVCADLARATQQAEGAIAQNFLADAYHLVQQMSPEAQAEILAELQKAKESMRELQRPAIISSVRVNVEQPDWDLVFGSHFLALRLAVEQIAALSVIDGTTQDLFSRLVMQGAEWFMRCTPQELMELMREPEVDRDS